MRAGIKAANNLPAGDNFNYYVCFPSFNEARNKDLKRILATMQMIVRTAGGSNNIESADVDDKFDLLLEINDQLLDQAVSIENLYDHLRFLHTINLGLQVILEHRFFNEFLCSVEYING